MTPRSLQQQQQTSQATSPFTNSGSSSAAVQGGFSDQQQQQQQQQPARNYIFSNALSSPVRRSLQNYHISQEGYGVKNNNDQQQQNNNNNRDNFDSSSMDMHADSGTGHDYNH